MAEQHHHLWTAARDLRLEATDSVAFITQAPGRWDELLDLRLPVLISSQAGSWHDLGSGLWDAGCPLGLPLRLIESHGRVSTVGWTENRLIPEPQTESWALALGWTHPDEGWRSRLPLWGRQYIVTRAAEKGQGLVQRLSDLGADAFSVPAIAFQDPDDLTPWSQAVERIHEFQWILFTSPNGVDYFVDRLLRSGRDLRSVADAKLACIGPSTARSLLRRGLHADLVPDEYVAEGLLARLRAELGDSLEAIRFLLPRAQVARPVLPEVLRAAGAEVLVAPVYKTVTADLSALPPVDGGGNLPRLLFTSSSTVDNWVSAGHKQSFPCYCIGPVTAATAGGHGLDVLGVAREYTVDGLVDTLLEVDGPVSRA